MREFIKSMFSFSWAIPLFGVKQLANIVTPQDPAELIGKATEAFGAMTQAAEEQLGDTLKGTFEAVDQLQRGMVDVMSSFLTLETFTPIQMMKMASAVTQQSSRTIGQAIPRDSHGLQNLGYSNASFQGRYGFSIIYGPQVIAGIGVAISDGEGHFYGIQKLNLRGQFIPFTFEGTYEVLEDGTGTASVKLTAPDGTIREGTFDYVVLQALDVGTVKLATELQGVDRTPQDGYYGVSWFKRLL